ncbi:MAG: hypothetical protein IJP48_06650 [Synergistaceae bacterium]|nr:hypothetical protein [Synergistaceae bacterium]
MRIFKGLENVHAIIDQHEAEWRRENGQEPLQPRPRVRARAKNIERQVVERYSESLSPERQESEKIKLDPERFSKSAEPQVKAINVIEQGDGEHHSWLYKEVMKAINDAADGNKNVKIVAVFIPVIQNSKEFDNFPADETVTVSSAVNEDDVHDVKPLISESESESQVNNANIVEDLIPPTNVEADPVLTEAFQTIEENLESNADSQPEPEHSESEPESESQSGLMMEAPDESEESLESGELPGEPVEAPVEEPQESEAVNRVEAVNPVEPAEPEETHETPVIDEPEYSLPDDPETEEIIDDGEIMESVESDGQDSESESELSDIPELDSPSDEPLIELAAPEEPVEAVALQEVQETEEPDAGFPLSESDQADSNEITEDGNALDSGHPEEDIGDSDDKSEGNKDDEDDEDELKDLKEVDIPII